MEYLFTQSIVQFASLRTFAQWRTFASIDARDLFPKARFAPGEYAQVDLFELAWSFLSKPMRSRISGNDFAMWVVDNHIHRTGDLPAEINLLYAEWRRNGGHHRSVLHAETGLTLPAIKMSETAYAWCQNGEFHRDDRDPRTGRILPAAFFGTDSKTFEWYHHGRHYRSDEDPITHAQLPWIIKQ